METFLVRVCRGLVTNQRKGTTRTGCWIPLNFIPHEVALDLDCVRGDAAATLAWDTHNADWRNMKNAKTVQTTWANAILVTMPNGSKGIALLDF